MNVADLMLESLRGWRRLFALLAGSATVVVLAALAGSVIVVPLWLLATNYTTAYTVFSLILLGGLSLTAAVVAVIRRHHGPGLVRRTILRALRTIGATLIALASVYALALLYWNQLLIPAIVGTILLVFLVGFFIACRSRVHGT